jgi:hypothetical protein
LIERDLKFTERSNPIATRLPCYIDRLATTHTVMLCMAGDTLDLQIIHGRIQELQGDLESALTFQAETRKA